MSATPVPPSRGSGVEIPRPVSEIGGFAAVQATVPLDIPPEDNFDRLAALAALLLRAPLAFVTIGDEVRSLWSSSTGMSGEQGTDRQNPVELSVSQFVSSSGLPSFIEDVSADPRVADNPAIAGIGLSAFAGIPLRDCQADIVGTFCAIDLVPRIWTERDVYVLTTLAAAISSEIALRKSVAEARNAALKAQQSHLLLSLLADVSEVLSTSLDAEHGVGLLAERIVPLLADWCLISVVDETTGLQRDIGRSHRDPALLSSVQRYARLDLDAAPIATVMRTARPAIIGNVKDELAALIVTDTVGRTVLPVGAGAIYPLQGRGGSLGAMALLNGPGRGAPTEDELSIGALMARRAGLSLDNERLHRRQRRIAEVLQRSMLSTPPTIEGLELAFRYLPAAHDAQVGGDWYDAYRLPDGATMLVIGDVMGHDLNAVSIMGQIRTMTRSISYDRNAGPGEIVIRVDAALQGLAIGGLCTALVMRVERSREHSDGLALTWCSAGHPSPMVVTADGVVTELVTKADLLLGIETQTERREHRTMLPNGATLLLMTDGLFERRQLTYDGALNDLGAAVVPLARLELEEFCDAVLAHAATTQSEDDIALIALRPEAGRRPASGRARTPTTHRPRGHTPDQGEAKDRSSDKHPDTSFQASVSGLRDVAYSVTR